MNDETIEQKLRELPQPELPAAWRAEIISSALHSAREEKSRVQTWPPLLLLLRKLFTRNPITSGVLATLWMLIFVFKASTPVDPSEKAMMAKIDPNRPVYIVSLRDQIELAEMLQNPPTPTRDTRIP